MMLACHPGQTAAVNPKTFMIGGGEQKKKKRNLDRNYSLIIVHLLIQVIIQISQSFRSSTMRKITHIRVKIFS